MNNFTIISIKTPTMQQRVKSVCLNFLIFLSLIFFNNIHALSADTQNPNTVNVGGSQNTNLNNSTSGTYARPAQNANGTFNSNPVPTNNIKNGNRNSVYPQSNNAVSNPPYNSNQNRTNYTSYPTAPDQPTSTSGSSTTRNSYGTATP